MGLRNRVWLLVLLLVWVGGIANAQSHRKLRPAVQARHQKITPAMIAEGKTYGVKTAPIRIDEFSDFECPACRELYMATLRQVIDEYVSSGKVYLVHHDFPLPMHRFSHQAAFYADAAAAIGRFGRVEQALFTHQPEWAENGKMLPFLAAVLTPAELRQVEELARTREIEAAVQSDVELGHQYNVQRTPTMFITHKGRRTPLVGVISYPILHRYIDALLQQ
jgi:protein-disulfide isomerase